MSVMRDRTSNRTDEKNRAASELSTLSTGGYDDGSVAWHHRPPAKPALKTGFAYRWFKRAVDLAIAAVMLLVLSPLLILIAVLVKTTSRGPVFYRQARHGLHKKRFTIMKFRTMRCATAKSSEFRQTARNDPRVTWIGRVLRVTSLDELPQLINVLKGEMSIVGPRPHAVEHDIMFANHIDNYWKRYDVLPGITGWAQIHGSRGATDTIESMHERVSLDVWYVDNRSILLDLKILLLTPRVLAGGNAY